MLSGNILVTNSVYQYMQSVASREVSINITFLRLELPEVSTLQIIWRVVSLNRLRGRIMHGKTMTSILRQHFYLNYRY